MKYYNFAFAFFMTLVPAGISIQAHASSWELVPSDSTLSFAGTQTGSQFSGQFRRFDANIELDPDDLSSALINVVVYTSSIASGSADRDSDALDSNWFRSSTFPEAVFTSSEIVHVENDSYLASGTLNIKGIENAVELPFTLNIEGDRAIADGSIRLNRIDYNLGASGEVADDSFVGHHVAVTIHVEAIRTN